MLPKTLWISYPFPQLIVRSPVIGQRRQGTIGNVDLVPFHLPDTDVFAIDATAANNRP